MPALGKPKAFRRPGIDLDRSESREWRDDVIWGDLLAGDLVVDLGLAQSIQPVGDLQTRIEFPNASIVNKNSLLVKAFVKING